MSENTGQGGFERLASSDYFKYLVEREVNATLSGAWARYKAILLVMAGIVASAAAVIGWHYLSILDLQNKIEQDRSKLAGGLGELDGLEKRLQQLKKDATAEETDVRGNIAALRDDIRNAVRDTREIAKLEAQQRQSTVQFFDLVNRLNQQQVDYVDRRAGEINRTLENLDGKIGKSDAKLEELRLKGEKIIDDFKHGLITAPEAAKQIEPLPTTMPSFSALERNAIVFLGEHPWKKLDEKTLQLLKEVPSKGE